MRFIKTKIQDIVIIEPKIFMDERGYFTETFRYDLFQKNIGNIEFVQDNESKSKKGVLRGLHYQTHPFAQSKLVKIVKGEVFDVAVDIRKGSPTFGKHIMVKLSEENKRQLFIPKGFAHGFLAMRDDTICSYKVDNYYSPEHSRCLRFDDPAIDIDWGFSKENIIISKQDKNASLLKDAEVFTYKYLHGDTK